MDGEAEPEAVAVVSPAPAVVSGQPANSRGGLTEVAVDMADTSLFAVVPDEHRFDEMHRPLGEQFEVEACAAKRDEQGSGKGPRCGCEAARQRARDSNFGQGFHIQRSFGLPVLLWRDHVGG